MKGKIGIGILITALIWMVGCHRSSKEMLPPDQKTASSDFAFLDVLSINYHNGYHVAKKDTISFAIDKKDTTVTAGGRKITYAKSVNIPRNTFFKIKFNEEVRWQIAITGLTSQAFKNLSGISSFLDSTNASWDGSSDALPLFSGGEWARAILTISGSSLSDTTNVYLHNGRAYAAYDAVLLNDFEGSLGNPITFGDKNDPIYYPDPAITSAIPAEQGKNCLAMAGNDSNGDYFIGGFQLDLTGLDTVQFVKYSPDEIYINAYVYGYGPEAGLTPKATTIEFGISEDENGDKAFDGTKEDTYVADFPVNHVGWKLMYARYSNLTKSVSKANGGNGNGIQEPRKAFTANFNLLSQPNGAKVATAVDYVIITFGKPYQP